MMSLEILTQIPGKSLCRFRQIIIVWLNRIRGGERVKFHFDQLFTLIANEHDVTADPSEN